MCGCSEEGEKEEELRGGRRIEGRKKGLVETGEERGEAEEGNKR